MVFIQRATGSSQTVSSLRMNDGQALPPMHRLRGDTSRELLAVQLEVKREK